MIPGDKALLYLRTLRYVRPIQVANRFWRRVRPVRVSLRAPPTPSRLLLSGEPETLFLRRPQSILGPSRFRFLNITRDLRLPEQWMDPGESRLWTYNLHYFDGLNAADPDPKVKRDLVRSWILGNGVGIGPGWEPYPLSLRIVNWIKWLSHRGKAPPLMTESIAHQVRYLIQVLEYHLLGNHLFANAKALTFAGLVFEGKEAKRWYSRGMDIVNDQAKEQFLSDGGHFELSPVYHAILTEDLLDLVHLHQLSLREPPSRLVVTARHALEWLTAMTRPDGLPPLFNDAAYGVAASRDALVDYAKRLGIGGALPVRRGLTILEDSGYVRYEAERYSVFWDVGEIGPRYIPGHAHCDMLSFEACVDGHPVVVDTGTSTYDVGKRRSHERGTSAHNTVQVGDLDQSEVWAGFRVARRATPTTVAQTGDASVRATLRGFPPRKVEHSREFAFWKNAVTIVDEVEGAPKDLPCVARFHFHPDEEPRLDDPMSLRSKRASMRFQGARAVRVTDYHYAPEFNRLVPARVAEVEFSGRLVTEIRL